MALSDGGQFARIRAYLYFPRKTHGSVRLARWVVSTKNWMSHTKASANAGVNLLRARSVLHTAMLSFCHTQQNSVGRIVLLGWETLQQHPFI